MAPDPEFKSILLSLGTVLMFFPREGTLSGEDPGNGVQAANRTAVVAALGAGEATAGLPLGGQLLPPLPFDR